MIQVLTNLVVSLAGNGDIKVVLIGLLFGLWLTPVRVAGDTMEPAFSADQVLLVDRAARFFAAPHS